MPNDATCWTHWKMQSEIAYALVTPVKNTTDKLARLTIKVLWIVKFVKSEVNKWIGRQSHCLDYGDDEEKREQVLEWGQSVKLWFCSTNSCYRHCNAFKQCDDGDGDGDGEISENSDIDIAHYIWKISISILLRKFWKILISIRKLSMVCHAWRNIDHWYVGISLNIDIENILKILISMSFFSWKKFIKISIRNFAKHI